MRALTIEEVARIARMYLDGDTVEKLLMDKTGPIDYDFERINAVKGALTRAERINPLTRCLYCGRPARASRACRNLSCAQARCPAKAGAL